MKPPKRFAVGVLVAAALAGNAALAQLKPSGPGIPPLAPTAGEGEKTDAQSGKEEAATAAAQKWLALIDAGDYGKAWDMCASLFKQRVKRDDWIQSLPSARGAFGAAKERKREVASYSTRLSGAPDGEYVTVRFNTQFDKKQDAQELLTLLYEDGAWRPTGYFIR